MTLVALAQILATLLGNTPPVAWAALSFAAGPVYFAARCPRPHTWLWTVALGIGIGALYHVSHRGAQPSLAISFTFGLGSSTILVAVADALLRHERVRPGHLGTAAAVALFPIKMYVGLPLLAWLALSAPLTFDRILTAIDRSSVGDLSFAIGRALREHPALSVTCSWTYNALPVAVMVVAALRWRKFGSADSANIPLSAAIAAIIGLIAYQVVPATGPVFAWGAQFPFHPPSVDQLDVARSPVGISSFRNALPSLHITGALIVLWGTWELGNAARAFGALFLLVTGIATLGTGQHYFIDLVAALPFAMAIEVLVRKPAEWRRTAISGVALTLAWMALIRWAPKFLLYPGVSLILTVATLVISTAAWLFRKEPIGRAFNRGEREAMA